MTILMIILGLLLVGSLAFNAYLFVICQWYDRRHEKMFLKRIKWDTRYRMLLKKYRIVEAMPRITRTDRNCITVSRMPDYVTSGMPIVKDTITSLHLD